MTILVDDVIEKASVVANDIKLVHWQIDELLAWLNEGARLLCVDKRDAYVKRAPQQLVAGAKQTLPDDAIVLLDVRNANGPILTCSKSSLDAFDPTWQSRTRPTVTNYMYSSDEHPVFWVYPAQSSTPALVELVYSAYPQPPVSGDSLPVLQKYEGHLVNYLLYRMFSKDAETGSAERASAYLQLFKS